MANLTRKRVSRLNRLPSLRVLQQHSRPEAQQFEIWREFLAEAQREGVLVLAASGPRTSAPESEYWEHKLQLLSGEPVEDSVFVRALYWHQTGAVEFVGYFS